jgi:hypothetical protein
MLTELTNRERVRGLSADCPRTQSLFVKSSCTYTTLPSRLEHQISDNDRGRAMLLALTRGGEAWWLATHGDGPVRA